MRRMRIIVIFILVLVVIGSDNKYIQNKNYMCESYTTYNASYSAHAELLYVYEAYSRDEYSPSIYPSPYLHHDVALIRYCIYSSSLIRPAPRERSRVCDVYICCEDSLSISNFTIRGSFSSIFAVFFDFSFLCSNFFCL